MTNRSSVNLASKNSLWQFLKNNLVLFSSGISLLLALLFLATNTSSFLGNTGSIIISKKSIELIPYNLLNQKGASFLNNGQTLFEGNVRNQGKMDCGSCLSGVSILRPPEEKKQLLDGAVPIKWYDLIIKNESGADLNNELQIVNSLNFSRGNLNTSRLEAAYFVHFLEDAVAHNYSNASHVNGYVGRTGIGKFIFPLGNGKRISPIQLRGSAPGTFFKAAYFDQKCEYDLNAFDQHQVSAISSREYWRIEGNDKTPIWLSWNEESDLVSFVDNIQGLLVVGWNGKFWQSLGNVDLQGNLISGSISSLEVIPDNYQAFTFGRSSNDLLNREKLDFYTELDKDVVQISWNKAALNEGPFHVEKSSDGFAFETLSLEAPFELSPNGKRLIFLDKDVLSDDLETIYYRLKKQQGENIRYSNTRRIVLKQSTGRMHMAVFPNPADQVAYIKLDLYNDPLIQIKIQNREEHIMYQAELSASSTLSLDVSQWPSDIYQVIIHQGARKFSQNLTVQHEKTSL